MNVLQAKEIAREWVEREAANQPGFRAAHLVGGITSLADEAPFPMARDIDLHLIFEEGSPALTPPRPGPAIREVLFRRVPIEAGLKSTAEYASPEAILANPEIAHHLTVDSVLLDPDGWLGSCQAPVRRDYAKRRWVCARLDHERRGRAGALALLPAMSEQWGAAGEANILGYSTTFLTAALAVAALGPPNGGSRTFAHLGDHLRRHGRDDLIEAVLDLAGVARATPEQARSLLAQGVAAFDLAVGVARSPGPYLPFEHKLHAHLRPYFVDACEAMLVEGRHREALAWTIPFSLVAYDVLLLDGPMEIRPEMAARKDALLAYLGFDGEAARAAKIAMAEPLGDAIFAVAEEIVAANPAIVA